MKMLLLQINYLKEKQNWKCKNVAVVAGKKHVKHLCMVNKREDRDEGWIVNYSTHADRTLPFD